MHRAAQRQKKHAESLRVGDKVAYSAMFLRSVGAGAAIARLRGTIIALGDGAAMCPKGTTDSYGEDLSCEIISPHFAVVSWDDGLANRVVGKFNLARVNSAAFSEAPHMSKTHDA